MIRSLVLCSTFLCSTFLVTTSLFADNVSQVVVQGNQRVETPTVLSYVHIEKGKPFDEERQDDALKSLFGTGLFSDVEISQQGGVVTIKVVENKVINRVAFEGNERIKDEILVREVSLIPRQVFTASRVQEAAEKIRLMYRVSGRYGAKVEPKIIEHPENRVDIVFEIDEGGPTRIEKINFVGNERFSDSSLQEALMTKEYRWYKLFSADDTYDPDRIAYDRELLRKYYLEHGYADFRVSSLVAELDPETQYFFVTFTVEEGERYTFGKLDANIELKGLDKSVVLEGLPFETGDWYNSRHVEKYMEAVTKRLAERGFHFVEIEPQIDRNAEDHTISLTFNVKETRHIFINRINIIGNDRTDEDVIRREIDLSEGDAYNKILLKKSERQLKDIDFFRKVEIKKKDTAAPDKVDLDVEVEDKPTGSMRFGAGYSTSDGALGTVVLNERNLLGKGYDFLASSYISQQAMNFRTGLTDPYFMNKRIAVGVDAYHSTQKFDLRKNFSDEFTQDKTGGGINASYKLMDPLTQSWGYTIRQDTMRSLSTNISQVIINQAGRRVFSGVVHSLFLDKRDDRLDPTEGWFSGFSNEVAGLGGNVRYVKNVASAGMYVPVDENHRWIVSLKGSGGFINSLGQTVRVVDRFMLGDDSLRGFGEAGVGPRDARTGDALGGYYFYKSTLALSFPLPVPNEFGVKGELFTDMGSVWGSKDKGVYDPVTGQNVKIVGDNATPRIGMGVGLNWKSPFGLIGVSFTKAVKKEKNIDRTKTFLINFGTNF